METISHSWKNHRAVSLTAVLVTFVEPVDAADIRDHNTARLLRSFGAWRDDRPIEATLADIHETRRSRTEPPAL